MKDLNLKVILKKAEELKSLFVMGKELIPLLEEIFIFISEIQPIIDEINQSLNENIKKMPSASEQISKVSEANEIATSQIIEIVEKIIEKIDGIKKNKLQVELKYNSIYNMETSILTEVINEINDDPKYTKLKTKIENHLNNFKIEAEEELKKGLLIDEGYLNEINTELFTIMMSLQIQDISTQQLAAVNHSILSIQMKLTNIVAIFQNSKLVSLSDEDVQVMETKQSFHREIAFDPNAIDSMHNSEAKQNSIDEMFMNTNDTNSKSSQNEIDLLFNN